MDIHPFSIAEDVCTETKLCVDSPSGTIYIDLAEEGIVLSVYSLATELPEGPVNSNGGPIFEAMVPHELINHNVLKSTRMPVPDGYVEITPDGSYYFRLHHDSKDDAGDFEVVMWDASELLEGEDGDINVYASVLNAIKIAATEGMRALAKRLGKI